MLFQHLEHSDEQHYTRDTSSRQSEYTAVSDDMTQEPRVSVTVRRNTTNSEQWKEAMSPRSRVSSPVDGPELEVEDVPCMNDNNHCGLINDNAQNGTEYDSHGYTNQLDDNYNQLAHFENGVDYNASDLSEASVKKGRFTAKYDHRYNGVNVGSEPFINGEVYQPVSSLTIPHQSKAARRPASASSVSTLSRCPSQSSHAASVCEGFFVDPG